MKYLTSKAGRDNVWLVTSGYCFWLSEALASDPSGGHCLGPIAQAPESNIVAQYESNLFCGDSTLLICDDLSFTGSSRISFSVAADGIC